MKRHILLTTALLASGVLLAGCTATEAATGAAADAAPISTDENSSIVASDYDLAPSSVMAENADYTTVNEDEWSEADAIDVVLSGSGLASAGSGGSGGSGAGDFGAGGSGVTAAGSTVTITEAGVYRLSGSLAGQLRVEAPEDALVVLLFDGVDIANESGAAIDVASADDVAIHLAAGSTNTVSDAASYAEDADANAAIYAATDLTISGDGSLAVTGNSNNGITSKDDLVILGGNISVTAADDALRGKDSLVVEGGNLSLIAQGGDGLKSDGDDGKESAEIDWTKGYTYVRGGTIDISAGDDGVQAFTDSIIAGGALTISAGDDGMKGEVIVSVGVRDGAEESEPTVTVSSSVEGLEAANVGISAGTIDVTASDDGINASGNAELQALIAGTEYVEGNREADTGERLEITGGTVTVVAGADGLDSNGSITVSVGTVTITSAQNGGEGPVDGNGTVEIADGVITANGSAYDESMSAMGAPGGMGGEGRGPGGGGMPGSGQPPQGATGELPEGMMQPGEAAE